MNLRNLMPKTCPKRDQKPWLWIFLRDFNQWSLEGTFLIVLWRLILKITPEIHSGIVLNFLLFSFSISLILQLEIYLKIPQQISTKFPWGISEKVFPKIYQISSQFIQNFSKNATKEILRNILRNNWTEILKKNPGISSN